MMAAPFTPTMIPQTYKILMGLVLAARTNRLAHQSHRNFQNRNTEHQAQHTLALLGNTTSTTTTTMIDTMIELLCFIFKTSSMNSKFARPFCEQSPRLPAEYLRRQQCRRSLAGPQFFYESFHQKSIGPSKACGKAARAFDHAWPL